jgi:hypothetical protein
MVTCSRSWDTRTRAGRKGAGHDAPGSGRASRKVSRKVSGKLSQSELDTLVTPRRARIMPQYPEEQGAGKGQWRWHPSWSHYSLYPGVRCSGIAIRFGNDQRRRKGGGDGRAA